MLSFLSNSAIAAAELKVQLQYKLDSNPKT